MPQIGYPFIAYRFGNRARQRLVRDQQPPAWRDAVGLVVETVRKHLGQISHCRRAEQLRVKSGYTIGAVRADDCEIRHADVLAGAFFDHARACNPAFVTGESCSNAIEQAAVDLVNDFELTREHMFKPFHRPFLQCFGQQRVVRISEGPHCDIPRLVPSQVCFIQQNSHQLGDRQRRVRIVELDGNFLLEDPPVGVAAPEAPDEIGKRAGNEKILLHEA